MTKKRILIIDDDEAVRNAFALALRRSPYDLVEAATGEEGAELAASQPFDLVYLDLRMPGIDGVETLRRIHSAKPDPLVYIVTAFHREFFDDLVTARSQGLRFELMRKPLERSQIIAITDGVLGGNRDTPE
jgi:DNA-binding response OmpR family regulator